MPWWVYDPQTETIDIRGDEAIRVAAQILPTVNQKGASARVVQRAVALASQTDNAGYIFSDAAHLAARARTGWRERDKQAKLTKMPVEMKLALEMISHEDAERRALEGELQILEEAWREAEEIAAISDDMFLPPDISERIAEMKRR